MAERYADYLAKKELDRARFEYQLQLDMLEYHAAFHNVKFKAPVLAEESETKGCSEREREKCRHLYGDGKFLDWACGICRERSEPKHIH